MVRQRDPEKDIEEGHATKVLLRGELCAGYVLTEVIIIHQAGRGQRWSRLRSPTSDMDKVILKSQSWSDIIEILEMVLNCKFNEVPATSTKYPPYIKREIITAEAFIYNEDKHSIKKRLNL